jgi:hypothetical protein
MSNPINVVPAADIPLGAPIIHASNGLGVLLAFNSELRQVAVKHKKSDEPTVYALSSRGILRLSDGSWIESAPKSDFTFHWADAAHPTYDMAADLPEQARGMWPLVQLAGEAFKRVIEQLAADTPTRPLAVGGRAPLGCWYNPQWSFDTTDRYLMTDLHSGIELTVAMRAALLTNAQGQRSLSVLGMQPMRQMGFQVTCQLEKIAVKPEGSDGVAQLRWGDDQMFYAHMCCLDEHAPYVHAGGHYDWLLSGVALSIKLADTSGYKVNKPAWLDAVNAKLAEPMQLDDEGNLCMTNDELRYLLPSEDFSPQHEFRGEVMKVTPCSFEHLVHGVYGVSGFVLEIAVLKDIGTDQQMRVRLVCPAKTIEIGLQPQVGQVVTGQLWLQAWLWMAQLPAQAPKPKAVQVKKVAKKPIRKTVSKNDKEIPNMGQLKN